MAELYSGKIVYVCARRAEVFIEKLNLRVRLTPYAYFNGHRLLDVGNDLSEHLALNGSIVCTLEDFTRKLDWRCVKSIVEVDNSGGQKYISDYGYITEVYESPMGWHGSVGTKNNGVINFEDRVVAVPYNKWKRPLTHLIPVDFTVKVILTTLPNLPNDTPGIVSVTPLTDFDEVEECYGTFDMIQSGFAILNERSKFGRIYMHSRAFRSNMADGSRRNLIENFRNSEVHFQVIKSFPNLAQEFRAFCVHLKSDCEFSHQMNEWWKPYKSMSVSEASARPYIARSIVPDPTKSLSFDPPSVSPIKTITTSSNENPLQLPSHVQAVLKSPKVLDDFVDFKPRGVGRGTQRKPTSAAAFRSLDFGQIEGCCNSEVEVEVAPVHVVPLVTTDHEVQTSRNNTFEREFDRFLDLFQANVLNDAETYDFLERKCQSLLLSGMRLTHLKSSFK